MGSLNVLSWGRRSSYGKHVSAHRVLRVTELMKFSIFFKNNERFSPGHLRDAQLTSWSSWIFQSLPISWPRASCNAVHMTRHSCWSGNCHYSVAQESPRCLWGTCLTKLGLDRILSLAYLCPVLVNRVSLYLCRKVMQQLVDNVVKTYLEFIKHVGTQWDLWAGEIQNK